MTSIHPHNTGALGQSLKANPLEQSILNRSEGRNQSENIHPEAATQSQSNSNRSKETTSTTKTSAQETGKKVSDSGSKESARSSQKGIDQFDVVDDESYTQFLTDLFKKYTNSSSSGGAKITQVEQAQMERQISDKASHIVDQIEELDVSEYKLNIVFDKVFTERKPPADQADLFEAIKTDKGDTLYFNKNEMAILEEKIKLVKSVNPDIEVSFVMLNKSALDTAGKASPNAIFTLPNTENSDVRDKFVAITEYITEEFMMPDPDNPTKPLVKGWILHNEIDANYTWAHAGKDAEGIDAYMTRYMDQLEILDSAIGDAAKMNNVQRGQAYIPVTRHWTLPHMNKNTKEVEPHSFTTKEMLEWIKDYEQDPKNQDKTINWGLGFHPYGKEPFLRDHPSVEKGPNAQNVDASNIWVLMNYLEKHHPFVDSKGVEHPRSVMFSEQGYPTDSRPKAADFAMAEKRLEVATKNFNSAVQELNEVKSSIPKDQHSSSSIMKSAEAKVERTNTTLEETKAVHNIAKADALEEAKEFPPVQLWKDGKVPTGDESFEELLDMATDEAKTQAGSILLAMTQLTLYPNIEAYHYHRFQDFPTEPAKFGLLDADGNKKLSYFLFDTLEGDLSNVFDTDNVMIDELWKYMGVDLKDIQTPQEAVKILNDSLGMELPIPNKDNSFL